MLIPNLALDFAGDICPYFYGSINTQKIFSLLKKKCEIQIQTFNVFKMGNLCGSSNYIKSK